MKMAVVASFGCPRSGTTFLDDCLEPLKGVLSFRIPDGALLHPGKRAGGLTAIDCLFWDRPLVFVRIVRDPMAIVESFLLLRKLQPDAARGKDTNQRIVDWIQTERENVAREMPLIVRGHSGWEKHHFVEMRYEDLREPAYRESVADGLATLLPEETYNRDLLVRRLGRFGGLPADFGRLDAEVSSVMTEEERRYFTQEIGGL